MSFQNPSFVRKIIYLTAVAVLLLPIAYLSQPASASRGGEQAGSSGGKLAQLRAKYNLSQAELGEIDPASETMKLATVGLRGVAVNALWLSAMHYQKVQDFNSLEATVKQIIRLQPNFLKVWDFQAHNLSYNTSVEFDNYRDRYQWVKKGIDFLILGTQYNRDEPGLLNSIGWFVGQKMGRSDENRQFRRLFKEDRDFHAEFRKHGVDVDDALSYDNYTKQLRPDSWLVAKLWYDKAEDAVARGKALRLKTPLLFYFSGPMSLINGAGAMEKEDGVFGQNAQIAWEKAHAAWSAYGQREILTSAGFTIRLLSLDELRQSMKKLEDDLDAAVPGVREALRKEKVSKLKPEEQAIVEKPADQRSVEESYRYNFDLAHRIVVMPDDIVARASRENRAKARDIADRITSLAEVIRLTALYRNTVNFEYWKTRCEVEQQPIMLEARELVHNADKLRLEGSSLSQARKDYEAAWDRWAVVFEKYPVLVDSQEGSELVESIRHYRDLLSQLELDFPADFKLNKLLDVTYEGQQLKKQIEIVQGAAPSTPSTPRKEERPPPQDGKQDESNERDNKGAGAKESGAKGAAPKAEAPAEAPKQDAQAQEKQGASGL
jgi:hypothetical protein